MLTWKEVINFSLKGNLTPDRRVKKTEAEWGALLTPEQLRITKQKGAEPPHNGALCSNHTIWKYNCACCNTRLFDSIIKFSSGTGWPSFTQPIAEDTIKYENDMAFGIHLVEVMYYTCDGHLGHVFPDGPKPSGLCYRINSKSMQLEREVPYDNS
jgi:peptide-methionine (R)-S-oxide reductase